jgi:hypothetical protein
LVEVKDLGGCGACVRDLAARSADVSEIEQVSARSLKRSVMEVL